MSKIYNFNNQEFDNLNDLALAYSKNYASAVSDVKKNYKQLFKFIKGLNKKVYKEALQIFLNSKYSTSVVSLYIHLFSKDKIVSINGNVLSFEDFISGYNQNKELYSAFVEDYGLDKTYCLDPKFSKLKENICSIRSHIYDPFVEVYLNNYFKYDGLEDLNKYLNINDGNGLFNKYNELFKQEEFQLILSQKYGLGNVIKLRNEEDYPIFEGLKLVKEYFNKKQILAILSNTHYEWLLDNVKNYSYASKTKRLRNEFKNIKKSYLKSKKSHDINKIIDSSSELSDLYLDFVNCFSNNLIKVKSNVEHELYELNINYCDTYVAKSYFEENNIEVSLENQTYMIEKYESKKKKIIKFEAKKERKRVKKLVRYQRGLVFFNLLALIIVSASYLVSLGKNPVINVPLSDTTLDIVAAALIVLLFIFAKVLSIKIEKSKNAYNKVLRLRNLYNEKLDVPNKNQEIAKLESKDFKNVKNASTSRRFITALSCAMLAFVYGVITIGIFNNLLLDTVNQLLDWSTVYNPNSSAISFLIFGPLLAFLFGLIKKKKGFFTNLLVIILAIVGVIIPVFLF